MEEVTYHGMMELFAKEARKKLKIICNNLKIMTAIDSNVKKYHTIKQNLASQYQLLCEKLQAEKEQKTKDFSNSSFEDQPNTSSDILPPISKHPQMQNTMLPNFLYVKSPSLPLQPPVSTPSMDHNDPPMFESPLSTSPVTQ